MSKKPHSKLASEIYNDVQKAGECTNRVLQELERLRKLRALRGRGTRRLCRALRHILKGVARVQKELMNIKEFKSAVDEGGKAQDPKLKRRSDSEGEQIRERSVDTDVAAELTPRASQKVCRRAPYQITPLSHVLTARSKSDDEQDAGTNGAVEEINNAGPTIVKDVRKGSDLIEASLYSFIHWEHCSDPSWSDALRALFDARSNSLTARDLTWDTKALRKFVPLTKKPVSYHGSKNPPSKIYSDLGEGGDLVSKALQEVERLVKQHALSETETELIRDTLSKIQKDVAKAREHLMKIKEFKVAVDQTEKPQEHKRRSDPNDGSSASTEDTAATLQRAAQMLVNDVYTAGNLLSNCHPRLKAYIKLLESHFEGTKDVSGEMEDGLHALEAAGLLAFDTEEVLDEFVFIRTSGVDPPKKKKWQDDDLEKKRGGSMPLVIYNDMQEACDLWRKADREIRHLLEIRALSEHETRTILIALSNAKAGVAEARKKLLSYEYFGRHITGAFEAQEPRRKRHSDSDTEQVSQDPPYQVTPLARSLTSRGEDSHGTGQSDGNGSDASQSTAESLYMDVVAAHARLSRASDNLAQLDRDTKVKLSSGYMLTTQVNLWGAIRHMNDTESYINKSTPRPEPKLPEQSPTDPEAMLNLAKEDLKTGIDSLAKILKDLSHLSESQVPWVADKESLTKKLGYALSDTEMADKPMQNLQVEVLKNVRKEVES